MNPEVTWLNPKGLLSIAESLNSLSKFHRQEDEGVKPNQVLHHIRRRLQHLHSAARAQELQGERFWYVNAFETLLIASVEGCYVCSIRNDAGEANVELTLNIEGECLMCVA